MKTTKRSSDFRAGIYEIEKEILEKEAAAIELALEDSDAEDISSMEEDTKSLKRKIHGDDSIYFKAPSQLASLSAGNVSEPSTDRPKIKPTS